MDRLTWISYLLALLFCISAINNIHGDELSEGHELMNDETVKNSKKLDLVFLLHTSTKISDMGFKLIVNFLKNVLRDVDVDSGDVHVGIAMYRRDPDIIFNLDQYNTKEELIEAIENIPDDYRSDEADLARGMKIVRHIMLSDVKDKRPSVPNAVVVITDGLSTADSNDLKRAAAMLKDVAYIFAVGIGIHTSAELKDVVSEPANINHFLVVSVEHLGDVEPQLTEQMMALQGDAAFPDGSSVTETRKADITFLVHVNKGTDKSDMDILVNFLKYLLTYADIDSGAVRVALAYYKLNVKVDFDFNAYSTKRDVFNALDQFKESKARSPKANVAGALKSLPRLLLNSKKGDRADAKNYVILVTDLETTIKKNLVRNNAQTLKDTGAQVLTVGVGLPDSAELRTIASAPAGLHSFFADYRSLNGIVQSIVRMVPPLDYPRDPVTTVPAPTRRVDPRIYTTAAPEAITEAPRPTQPAPRPTQPAPRPTQPDRVEVPTKSPEVKTPEPATLPRTAPPPPPTTTTEETVTRLPSTERPVRTRRPQTPLPVPSRRPATPTPAEVEGGQDIILMLDTSVDSSLFQWMIAFARAFTGQAAVNSGQMRIGLMVFSDEPIVEAQLNSYLNQADLLQAVDTLPHLQGKSDKSRAFRKVTTEMFTPRNGDRPQADNKIILLTGSKSINSGRAMQEARLAKERTEAEVFVLGLNVSDPKEPNSIGSRPTDEHVFLFKDPSVILRETARLLDKIQEEYVPPAPSPTTPRRTRPPVTTPRTTPRPRTTTPRRRRPPTTTTRRPTTTTTRRPTTTTTRRPTTTTPRRTTTPRIYLPSECTAKSDIVFIVDSSGSVGDEDFRKVMDFVYRTIDSLDIKSGLYNIGLITFSDQARIEFYLNSFTTKEEIENATASVRYIYGSTHTAMALHTARQTLFTEENGDRPDAPNLAIIITDGQSNINHEATLPQARMLKNSGATILTVAVGFATHTDELVGMTSQPVDENLFSVDHFSGLEDLHTKIVEPICKGRNHCAKNPCKNGAECYDTLRSYICICAEGYFGFDCDKTCPQPADIAFVVDSSSSVGIISFNQMKAFVDNLIRELEPEKCDHHIALMKYSSRPIVEFTLNRYTNSEAAIRAVNGMSYTRGYANMANAMKALRESIFNGRSGDRPTVKNIAYLLTDGQVDVARDQTLSQAELTVSSGIHVVPIGFDLRNREEVDFIAASQGIKAVEIAPASDVESLSESLLYAVFDNEDRCNPNPCSNGATCINQALSFKCECILGYSGETCEKRCESEADVVFVVDTSRYIPRRLLKQVKRMLRRTVKRLSFKSKNMRVGLVSFDGQARVRLDLENGEVKRNVLAAISSLRPGKTNPNPGNALRLTNQRIFDKKLGDRTDVPNYLVLVTKSARDLAMMVDQARHLKMKGTRIISIALTGTTASTATDLSEIVSLPVEKNKYLIPNNTEDHEIFDIIENLVEVVCYEKACLYSPCHNGGTCMPDDRTYVCQCPPGFAGRHCETECNQEADLIFLLDSSGSVSKDEFRKMKEFIISLSEKFSIGYSKTRIGAATYSSSAFLGFNLNAFNSASMLRNAMSSLPYIYGNTNTAAGLKLVRTRMLHYKAGDRPQSQNFVIILTNGKSNIDSELTIAEANELKKHAHVYAVAIGSFDDKEIKEIASAPAALNAFTVPDYESLFQITDKVIGTVCKTFNPCDESPCQNGAVCIPEITTYTCECRLGYAGKMCERRCNPNKDVAFILDASSSIGVENFKRILKFIGSLVHDLSHKNSKMRYSLITFSTKGTLVFSFGRFLDAKLIKEVIEQTAYTPGSTNIAAGLRNAADAFSNGYGSRPNADNFAIFITDGYANIDAHLTVSTAEALKAKVKKVIGIGIGLDNTDELAAIASGETNVFVAENFLKLSEFETNVLAAICAGDEKEEAFYSVPREGGREPYKINVA